MTQGAATATMPQAGAGPRRALVTPAMDFLLVGGAALVTFFVFLFLAGGWDDPRGQPMQDRVSWWAYLFAFGVNYPHFMYSYMLFYPDFWQRLWGTETTWQNRIRICVAGILVPVLMVAFFFYAWHTQDSKYLGWGVLTMIFSVGWHYVRQGYGVFITLSVYRGVFYSDIEKNILNTNAYLIWLYAWCRTNSNPGVQNYYTITYNTFAYPHWLVAAFLVASCLSSVAAGYVLLKHWLVDKKGIALNGLAGYLAAIYMWVMVPYLNKPFYVLIPLFHSMQYLPFVFKYKRTEYLRAKNAPEGNPARTSLKTVARAVLFTCGGVVLGALMFDLIPKYIDNNWGITPDTLELDPSFFLIAFLVFINVHHFFIDSAFWRRDNLKVQQYLFRA